MISKKRLTAILCSALVLLTASAKADILYSINDTGGYGVEGGFEYAPATDTIYNVTLNSTWFGSIADTGPFQQANPPQGGSFSFQYSFFINPYAYETQNAQISFTGDLNSGGTLNISGDSSYVSIDIQRDYGGPPNSYEVFPLSGTITAVMQPVPIPGSGVLLASCLIGFGISRSRSRSF